MTLRMHANTPPRARENVQPGTEIEMKLNESWRTARSVRLGLEYEWSLFRSNRNRVLQSKIRFDRYRMSRESTRRELCRPRKEFVMRKRGAMRADRPGCSRYPRPCRAVRVPVRLRRTQCECERCDEQQRDRRSQSMHRTVKLARHGQHLLIIPRRRTESKWWSLIAVQVCGSYRTAAGPRPA